MVARLITAILLTGLATLPVAAAAVETWREPATGMEFAAMTKGCFQMGLPAGAFQQTGEGLAARVRTEMPEHEVCLDAFWIARHEVRVSEWETVMGMPRGSGPADVPVTGVRWEEAIAFTRRLTALSGGKARFRLPTEAEWEYACRAGAKALTGVPDRKTLERSAWFSSSYDAEYSGVRLAGVQPVGQKMPNAWGLHDMLGNAWEWVQDTYSADGYARHKLYNPVAAGADGAAHVLRGGGLRTDQRLTRCEVRSWIPAGLTHDTAGLRLVREADGPHNKPGK